MSKETLSDVLPKWLTKQEGKLNGIQIKSTGFQKYNLAAAKPSQEKQELVIIPGALAITAAATSLHDIRAQLASLDESTSSEAEHAVDDLVGVEELAVSILWEQAHAETSKWKPYLQHLPASIDSVISSWTEAEREELRGTHLLPIEDEMPEKEEGAEEEDEEDEEEEVSQGPIRTDKAIQKTFDDNIFPLLKLWWAHEHQAAETKPELPASFTWEKYKSIFSIVLSFGNETVEGEPCLIPFAELLQYTMEGAKANASFNVDKDGNYKIISVIPINKGDTIVVPCMFPLCNSDLLLRFGASAIKPDNILDYSPEKEKQKALKTEESSSSSSSGAKGKKGKKKAAKKEDSDSDSEPEERLPLLALEPSEFKPFDLVSIGITHLLDYYDQKGEMIELYEEKLNLLNSIGMLDTPFVINSYDMEFPTDLLQTVSIICMGRSELEEFAETHLGISIDDLTNPPELTEGCEDEDCTDTSCCPTEEQDLKDEDGDEAPALIPAKAKLPKVEIDVDEEDIDEDDDEDDEDIGDDEEEGELVLAEDQVKMFGDLIGILTVRLQGYTTTLQDDEEELPKLKKTDAKKIGSLLVRIGEKRLLLAMTDYAIYQKSLIEEAQQRTAELKATPGQKRPRPESTVDSKKAPKAKKQKKNKNKKN